MEQLKDGKKTSAFLGVMIGVLMANLPMALQLLSSYKEALPANSWVSAVVTGFLALGYAVVSIWRSNNDRDNKAKIEIARLTGQSPSTGTGTYTVNIGSAQTVNTPAASAPVTASYLDRTPFDPAAQQRELVNQGIIQGVDVPPVEVSGAAISEEDEVQAPSQ